MAGYTKHDLKSATTRTLVHALLAWFAANARELPWRRARDPYAIWVSEIMLQQTQVATVVPYWERWMRELPTLQAVAKARPEKLRKLWEGLGYYTRVRNLQAAARQILVQHEGRFPEDFEAILALSGIGRYTAGAIASIAFNQPRPILDGNVMRVLTRLFAIRSNPRESKTNAQLWQLAEELVGAAHRQSAAIRLFPEEKCGAPPSRRHGGTQSRLGAGTCSALNQSLMELGAVVCMPRNPRCGACPVARFCNARRLGLVERLPNTGKRVRAVTRRLVVFWVERDGRILARQRPAGVVNAHFWELPNLVVEAAPDAGRSGVRPMFATHAETALPIRPASTEPLDVMAHTITRYRIRVQIIAGELVQPLPDGRWLTRAQLQKKPFTGLDRKILRRFKWV